MADGRDQRTVKSVGESPVVEHLTVVWIGQTRILLIVIRLVYVLDRVSTVSFEGIGVFRGCLSVFAVLLR